MAGIKPTPKVLVRKGKHQNVRKPQLVKGAKGCGCGKIK